MIPNDTFNFISGNYSSYVSEILGKGTKCHIPPIRTAILVSHPDFTPDNIVPSIASAFIAMKNSVWEKDGIDVVATLLNLGIRWVVAFQWVPNPESVKEYLMCVGEIRPDGFTILGDEDCDSVLKALEIRP